MIAALPTWLSDMGAGIGIALAFCLLIGALAGAAALGVRVVVKPSLDAINKRIEDHMDVEERQIDRIAQALEILSRAVGVKVPSIVVSGGADEGDTDETP